MKIIFFGTSGGIPTKDRNVTSMGLQRDTKSWSMFDCGDGTTFQIAKTSWDLGRLDSIFITHLHADHFFGILSVLFRKDMLRENCDLTLYAPKGVKQFILNCLDITQKVFEKFQLNIVEIDEGMKIEFKDMQIKVLALQHRITSYGYHIEIMGKKLIIAGDNEQPEIMKEHLYELDLLVHESTFREAEYEENRKKSMHTTAKLLGEVANRYKVKRVIATHISGRYHNKALIQGLQDEIALSYKNQLDVADDLDEFEL